MDEPQEKDDSFPKTYIYESPYGGSVTVKPELAFYNGVRDWFGDAKQDLAITLKDADTGEGYTTVTVNLGEFIGTEGGAYIDTNNNPGIDRWLEDNGIARITVFTKESGFCTYPLAVFNEGFLASIDDGILAQYYKQYELHMNIDEAAWAICGKGKNGPELWFFEAHLAEDADSPTGEGYFFTAFKKEKDGWRQYDGGQYWGYEAAVELEEVIGETIPFREFQYKEIDYADLEDICSRRDEDKERAYAESFGLTVPERVCKQHTYEVTIAETLKRTVTVKASSEHEAHEKVEDDWKNGVHVLGADDFKEVHFTARERQPDKELAR